MEKITHQFDPQKPPLYIKLENVSIYYDLTKRQAYELILQKKVVASKTTRRWLIKTASLEKYLKSRENGAKGDA